tara:strand:+ start:258 stop:800 length:543 start_codon:yes stop_codon:yes gene_type:complete
MHYLILIFVSFLFVQEYDPMTGEKIQSDSLKIKFDPITGEKFKVKTIENTGFDNFDSFNLKKEYTSKEVRQIAYRDLQENLNKGENSALVDCVGPGVSCLSASLIGPFFVFIPFLLPEISVYKHSIPIDSEYHQLNDNHKKIYYEHYEKIRKSAIRSKVYANTAILAVAFIFVIFSSALN